MKNSEKIKSPFIMYCQKVIPLAFDESMSYYEVLCSLISYLKTEVIPAVNNNADAITELQNYVNNYFENLDVQEEINNKLDEMAKSGELETIIAEYLNTNCILAYNTVNDMKNANNFINGSFARTYGKNNYLDGYGNFYKIRNITSSDVVDEVNIIKINTSTTLIAELIPNFYEQPKKYLFLGDSYGSGEIGSSWVDDVISYLGLTKNKNAYNYCLSGSFFYKKPDSDWYSYLDQLNKAYDELTEQNMFTDIVVCGGYNDVIYQNATEQNIADAIQTFVNTAKLKFPNAKITIGHIGWCAMPENFEKLRISIRGYKRCTEFGCTYINNIEYSMHNYGFFKDDKFHPNEEGNKAIARNVVSGLVSGSCDVHYETNVTLTPYYENGFTLDSATTWRIKSWVDNDITSFEIRRNDGTNKFNVDTLPGDHVYSIPAYNADLMFKLQQDTTCYLGETLNMNNTSIFYSTGSADKTADASITITYGNMILIANSEAITDLKNLIFTGFTLVSSSLYC